MLGPPVRAAFVFVAGFERREVLRNVLNLIDCGRVAQLAEQCPFKAWVDGSSPSALTTLQDVSSGSAGLISRTLGHSNSFYAV
jgi:hypothetical protein